MAWDGPSLKITSVVAPEPVVATNDPYPIDPPKTPPAAYEFALKGAGFVGGTKLLFIHAKEDGRLAHYDVVDCFDVALGGTPAEQTVTFRAYFNQRAPGRYHLAAWKETDKVDVWEGHQQTFVYENAIEVGHGAGAAPRAV